MTISRPPSIQFFAKTVETFFGPKVFLPWSFYENLRILAWNCFIADSLYVLRFKRFF